MSPLTITRRQQDVLSAMRRFLRIHGRLPSITELARMLGRTRSVTHHHLVKLLAKGAVCCLAGSKTNFYAPAECAS